MSNTYRVVRLMKNHLYPTYQLHAYMANKKTAPRDGLRLAGLITMEWLRQRLGDHAPEEFLRLPEPSAYLSVDDSCLPSLHINSGFLIDIVSLPDQGIWTLQITEPDLGSDPGNPQQARQAVPGRVIETNVGFKISGAQLECGFQTVISDPEGTPQQAEVYRLAFIRRLVDHPDFGLKQLSKLTHEPQKISTVDQLKTMLSIWKDQGNQLPCVVFTYTRETQPTAVDVPEFISNSELSVKGFLVGTQIPGIPVSKPVAIKLPYDVEPFAKYGVTFCRSYILDDPLLERFISASGVSALSGDIIILEPIISGGKSHTIPYKPSKTRQEEAMNRLRDEMYGYSRGKLVTFGNIQFLSAAREGLLRSSTDAMQQSAETSDLWAQKLALNDAQWRDKLREKEKEYHVLAEQLDRQKQYQERLEKEKEKLREDNTKERHRMNRTPSSRQRKK